jgi:DNA excision repair protein ERCC-6
MMDPSKIRWEDSGKLMVLWKVLPLWYSEGHKVLLFTQTHSMLNLLELMMKQFSFRFMRLDGMTPVSKREGIIETFNKDPTVFLMILTTRTGGVGISLTAANRVVLIDPDWNPQVRIDTSNSTI